MVANIYCRAYPDEKGIETMNGMIPSSGRRYIAEPIPMKRELKPILSPGDSAVVGRDCRAYPDEKGIETMKCLQGSCRWFYRCESSMMKRELKR